MHILSVSSIEICNTHIKFNQNSPNDDNHLMQLGILITVNERKELMPEAIKMWRYLGNKIAVDK